MLFKLIASHGSVGDRPGILGENGSRQLHAQGYGHEREKSFDMNCGVHVYVFSNSVETFCAVKNGRRAHHPVLKLES